MKKFFIFLLVLFSTVLLASSDEKIKGFLGMTFGESLQQCKDKGIVIDKIEKDDNGHEFLVITKEKDKIAEKNFSFFENQLYGISLDLRNKEEYTKCEKEILEKYGNYTYVQYSEFYYKRYEFYVGNVVIELFYNAQLDYGYIFYQYVPVINKAIQFYKDLNKKSNKI